MGYIPRKNIYNARIGDKELQVDIYNLPYDEFNEENPLIITDMVILSDQTKTTDLSNVHIIGGLDISKQRYYVILPKIIEGKFICRSHTQMRDFQNKKTDIFHESFIFPKGLTEIDCSHSIPSLSFLKGRIPNTVKKIIVADSLLSNISSDIEKLAEANLLLQQYPGVIIIGDKKGINLSESVKTKPIIIKQEIIKQPVEKPEYLLRIKTENFYDIKDIMKEAKQNITITSFKILDATLEREIRKLMSKYNKQLLKNTNTGSAVVCIEKDKVADLLDTLIFELQAKEDKKTENKRKKQTLLNQKEDKTAGTKPVATEDVSLIPINIQKYIPKKLWQKIKSLCNKNDFLIKSVLEIISSVNTDINETPIFTPLQIINTEENTRASCAYLQKEGGNCIVQSVSNSISKDRKRIVWTFLPKEKILVCTSVYKEHFCFTGKTKESLKYSKSIDCAAKSLNDDSEEITIEKIKTEEYFNVDVLLAYYTTKTSKEVSNQTATSSGNTPENITTDTQETQQPETEKTVKKIYKKTNSQTIQTKYTMNIAPTNKTVNATDANKENLQETQMINIGKINDMSDICAAEIKIQSIINIINNSVNEKLIAVTKENDASRQLDLLKLVQEALIEKEKMQQILPSFSKTEEILTRMQTIYQR